MNTATASRRKKSSRPSHSRRRKPREKESSSGRPLWSGSISFGLVNIPVRLYSAVREQRVVFHMLHDQDKMRLRRRMVCPADGKEIHPEHIVRGFEYSKDQYVVVRDEELESCAPERSKTIEITDFVELSEIDPLYFDRPYYVLPQSGASKPYRLLVEAMTRAKRVGLARLVMHEKEHLAALRPLDGLLCIETMYFGDEIVPVSDIEELSSHPKIADKELKAAAEIIAELSGDFDPKDYRDTYRECVREMVKKKAKGENLVTVEKDDGDAEEKKPTRSASNLMAALEASLAKARGQSSGKRRKSE